MCLAYPMTLISIDGAYAVAEAEGVRRRVGLALLPEARVGDAVLIHAGYAISLLDPEEAEETRRMFRAIEAVEQTPENEDP